MKVEAAPNGGYRTSHVGRAVTVGNETPVPGLASKVPSGSVPDQRQVAGVVADSAVGQPGRGTREDEPGQHVGLEVRELFRARCRPMLAEVTHQGQSQLTPPDFT